MAVEVKTDDLKTQDFLNCLEAVIQLISKEETRTDGYSTIIEHSENVGKYVCLIYDNLPKRLQKYPREHIRLAGYYHDIGKLMIHRCYPELLGKSAFDSDDRITIKEHTHFGVILLYLWASRVHYNVTEPIFRCLHEAVLYHHERTDGSGYLGLTDNTPFLGELVAVADCFSAGIENRVYGTKKSYRTMLKELRNSPLNQRYVKALIKGLRKSSENIE